MQALINAIQMALLRDADSVIAVHTDEEKALGERSVERSKIRGGEVAFLVLPPHLHGVVPAGTFLDAEADEVEEQVRNNSQGIQVILTPWNDG